MGNTSCLLLASQGAEAERIAGFCRRAFEQVQAYHGNWGDPLPEAAKWWEGDLILSYCSRWVVPHYLLERSKLALNFHPAPPEYPGTGGLNWALYEDRDTFGVTCHHMTPSVDAGPIVEVRRFCILPDDNVSSLFDRTHGHLEALACDIIAGIATGRPLPSSSETWGATARKRTELDAMMLVPPDATAEELARRKRAFVYGSWGLKMNMPCGQVAISP